MRFESRSDVMVRRSAERPTMAARRNCREDCQGDKLLCDGDIRPAGSGFDVRQWPRMMITGSCGHVGFLSMLRRYRRALGMTITRRVFTRMSLPDQTKPLLHLGGFGERFAEFLERVLDRVGLGSRRPQVCEERIHRLDPVRGGVPLADARRGLLQLLLELLLFLLGHVVR